MKKILFASVFVVSTIVSSAQVNKGQWLVGGRAGFSASKEGDYKTREFELSPNAGYFFINNFAGGLRVNVQSSKTEFESSESTSSVVSLAPFVRYYFLPAAEKVNIFADASYGFGTNKYESSNSQESKVNFSGFSIDAGPAIFLTPNTALELTLGYNSFKTENADDATGTFRFGVGFQIHLGSAKK